MPACLNVCVSAFCLFVCAAGLSPFPKRLLDKFSLTRSRERSEWTVIDENGKEGREGSEIRMKSYDISLS